ncbi:MAG: hypothetical protein A3F17_02505 [Gammaproteobacteria bacterium RIFCSPHIGHO2_12_FULL_41_15]|nr:MAG: hypothetical protein A3F17_02505 [Gammaproteobacteria bacterium RIFCSPHIGHO2_12_FULL_41_15]
MQQANLTIENSVILVSGTVDVHTVLKLRREGEKAIATVPHLIEVDLEGVQKIDSSIASLLCCWHRFAKKQQKQILFKHISVAVLNLLKLYGIKNILTLNDKHKELQNG